MLTYRRLKGVSRQFLGPLILGVVVGTLVGAPLIAGAQPTSCPDGSLGSSGVDHFNGSDNPNEYGGLGGNDDIQGNGGGDHPLW
jgi:hypothetical protein